MNNIVYFDLETQKSAGEVGGWDRKRDMLMGEQVPPRKHFIQTHARSVRNLDV